MLAGGYAEDKPGEIFKLALKDVKLPRLVMILYTMS
jgi:hypothetical protein